MKPFRTADAYAADLQQAYDYFKRGGQAAADRFLARYERRLLIVTANPLVSHAHPNGWRHSAIPMSAYAIYYREAPEFWFLGGIVSAVQDPDLIQARLLIRELKDPDRRV